MRADVGSLTTGLEHTNAREVAQLGSAPALGAGGRGFKSRLPDRMTSPEATSTLRTVAAACARGDTTARAVVEDFFDRLRLVDERTNCVATWNHDDALTQADSLDDTFRSGGPVGPLHGVPITVKDWIDVAGLPCSGGWIEHRDRVPTRDATVVSRLRAAGAVIMAKTAVQVDSPVYGPVFHPRDATRSPGASSSGEAAAVAGGGSPGGVGSDSGGSIRLPAAWSGAAGFKPTFGRVPNTGHFPRVGDRSDGRTQIGPIASTVPDLVEILRVIAGPDQRDAGVVPVPLGDPATVAVGGLRIGWMTSEASWQPDDAIGRAVESAVASLATRGASAVGEVPQHLDEAFDITLRYWQRSSLSGADADRQLTDWDRFRSRALGQWDDVDVILMPVTRTPAPQHRAMEVTDYVFTLPASLTGTPAAVVPVGEEDGLPIAVQVVARPWADHVALAVASALESGPALHA